MEPLSSRHALIEQPTGSGLGLATMEQPQRAWNASTGHDQLATIVELWHLGHPPKLLVSCDSWEALIEGDYNRGADKCVSAVGAAGIEYRVGPIWVDRI